MPAPAKIENDRIDFDGIDVSGAIVQRHCCIVAAARSEDENALWRPSEQLIRKVVARAQDDRVFGPQSIFSSRRRRILMLCSIRENQESLSIRQIDFAQRRV